MAADTFQLKRGTTAAVNAYLPAVGEPVYDITLKKLKIGDGVTLGGVESTPTNDNLSALAGLTGAADKGLYFTDVGAMSLFDLTPVARALLDDTTVAAQRTTLGATSVGSAVFTAVDATAARLAIGAVIGTDVQAFDADLTALATNVTNGLWTRTASGTGSARAITGTANKVTVTNGDGVAGNPTLTLPDALTLVTPTVTGALTVTGGQIAFPAVQVPSADVNTLDDYEEGTFNPSITFATPGDLNVVYSSRIGVYTKVGRLVHFTINLLTTTFTHTTASGTLQISGLPFTSTGNHPTAIARWVGVTSATATPQIVAYVGGSVVQLEVMNVATGAVNSLTTANAPTGVQKNIYISGTYNV